MRELPVTLAVALVRVYQRLIGPLLPPVCRFWPSCSQYCVEALQQKGLIKGSLYAAWRILRCNPFSKGGFDPVP
jgi:uncharacterized protein